MCNNSGLQGSVFEMVHVISYLQNPICQSIESNDIFSKKSQLSEDQERYKILKRQARHDNKRAYASYVRELVTDYSNKHLWKFIQKEKCDEFGILPPPNPDISNQYQKHTKTSDIPSTKKRCWTMTTDAQEWITGNFNLLPNL